MKYLFALAFSTLTVGAYAQGQPDHVSVEDWLDLQRQGLQASALIQSATPAERERSATRWLKSFEHEIPATFQDDSIGSD